MDTGLKTFKESLRNKNFVLCAELPMKPEMSAGEVIGVAQELATRVDGILLSDNQYGQTHISPIAAASLLLSQGIDPIVQLSCRNRNRLALLSELLGARALGVTSVMLIQGSKIPDGFNPRPRSVMDMQARELIATAQLINDDEKLKGEEFLIIASGTVHDPQPGWKPEELLAKSTAGARIIITQLCFDLDLLRRYMACLVSERLTHDMSFIVNLAVLPSARMAKWLRDNRRRALIPTDIIERLEQATDPEAEGITISSELLQQYAEIPGVSGVNLITTGSADSIVAAIGESGLGRVSH